MVPREGLEPSIRYRPRILSPVRIPFRHLGMEVRAGIEPAHRGFADRSVTTSPPRGRETEAVAQAAASHRVERFAGLARHQP